MATYSYKGACDCPETEYFVHPSVTDADIKLAISSEDYQNATKLYRGWYLVAIDIKYKVQMGGIYSRRFTGYAIADSVLDAYIQAKNCDGGIRYILPRGAELLSIARIDKCDIEYRGMTLDDGSSVDAMSEILKNKLLYRNLWV